MCFDGKFWLFSCFKFDASVGLVFYVFSMICVMYHGLVPKMFLTVVVLMCSLPLAKFGRMILN